MAFNSIFIVIAICLASLANAVAITGPPGGVNNSTGQRPFRQEFSTFKESGPAFDLYILSLQKFQQQNQSALLSYYQQILWKYAQQIATTYPTAQRSTYQAAATTLRVPYWDWVLNATMPDPVNSPMISVNSPHGVTNIVNPLYNYTFHPQPSAVDFPPSDGMIAEYHSTVRYPSSSGQSQPGLANLQLEANAQAIHDATYQLIADQSNYPPFSNTGYTDGRGGSYNSLENMHNAIHSLVGNGGHMGYIPYAGFDPIFWLHHANVDRLFAIWQAMYPDSYTTAEADAEGTFTNAPGETEDVNTSLTPFHSDSAGTLYTSASVRSTRPFGYTYPEVVDWGVNASQLSSNTRTAFNKLYNPSGSLPTRSLLDKRDDPTAPHTNATEYEYSINIRVPKAALNRPFFIHFFLGPVPPTPLTWSFAPTLIASQSILYHPLTTTTTTTTLSYGQIPLTRALRRSHRTAPLDPRAVVPLLGRGLRWAVQDFEDRVVPTVEVGGLRVFVVGRAVVGRRGEGADGLTGYGPYTIYRAATRGKVGGLPDGEGM
ncbi:hypothetical protein HO133_004204 [Letharia lupina]|uniref:tyrosinase n=1 Tax=Letharia lupina TaxID=560253 RepID=A0A8H6FJX5_9LECA|nr:uncharacterized protein HO133_004204 [Letharia lupina]KAF6229867.1 hypothetical protein HO133_004204 [Letharia lupina]